MKKLLALLMALTMSLSCLGALAAEPPAGLTLHADISLALNNELLASLAGVTDEGQLALLDAVLDIAENATLCVAHGDNAIEVALLLADTPLLTANLTRQEDGSLIITSSAFPSYAILLKGEDIAAFAGQFTQGLGLNISLPDIDAAMDVMSAKGPEALAMLTGYWEDLQAVAQGIMATAETPAEGAITVSINAYAVADLLDAWAARFATDEALRQMITQLLAYINKFVAANSALGIGPIDADVEHIDAALTSASAAIRQDPDEKIITVSAYTEADGSRTLEYELIDIALISLNAYAGENMNTADIIAIFAENEAGDWQATYDAIMNGTDTDGGIISVSTKMERAEGKEAAEGSLYITSAGQTLGLVLSAVVENVGTPEFKGVASLAFDMGLGEPLLSIDVAAGYAEPVAAPVLDGLTIIDLPAMQDAATVEALTADIMANGLTGILVGAQTAMPEQVELILNLIMASMTIDEEATTTTEILPEGT